MKPRSNQTTSTPNKVKSQNAEAAPEAYWSLSPEALHSARHTTINGLQPLDAEQRLKHYGLNTIKAKQ